MTITPIDIQQHRFKTSAFGYEKAGVDSFLEQIAEELELFHRHVQELKEELARNRAALGEMRQREEMLKDTLLTAQKMTGDIKANAVKEAEIMIAEAGMQGEKIIHEAENQRIELINELRELRRQKVAFESGLRALVESHLRMLDVTSFFPESSAGKGGFLQGPSDDNADDDRPTPAGAAGQKRTE
jgi:cell division initiation protein